MVTDIDYLRDCIPILDISGMKVLINSLILLLRIFPNLLNSIFSDNVHSEVDLDVMCSKAELLLNQMLIQ